MKRTALLLAAVLGLGAVSAGAGTVLILPFENRTHNAGLDWIGESVAEWLGDQLRAPDRYVVSRAERAAVFDQLGIPSAGILSHATIFKLADLADADLVALGSFELANEKLTLRGQVLDMKLRRLSSQLEAGGPLSDLLEIQTGLGASLLKAAGLPDAGATGRSLRLDSWENYIRGLTAGEQPKQVKFFREAARLDPAFSAPAFQLGKIYFQNRDYPTAIPWLARLKKDDANYLEASFLLGLAYLRVEEYDKAEASFLAVTEKLPLNEAYNNLGVAQAKRGKKAAAGSFQMALAGDPDDPDYYFNLGYFYWKTGDFAQAARRFRETLARRPRDPDARRMLNACLSRLGQAPEPGEPGRPGEERRLEGLERLKENYEEASFRQLRLALEAAGEEKLRALPPSEHAARHVARGRERFDEGLGAEALADFQEAARLDPQNAEAHFFMAQIHARAGRAEEAKAFALLAEQYGKKGAEPFLALARIYLEQRKYEEALDAGRQALAREPGNEEVQALLEKARSGQAGAPRP